MLKKIFVLTVCVLIISGCSCSRKINQNDNLERFYLEDKYYKDGNFIEIDSKTFNKISGESYVLYTYNNYCSLAIPCEDIFSQFMKKYKIDFLSIPFGEFKETEIYQTVKYAPSVIIVKNGKIIAYLDSESDEDLKKYQDTDEFEQWMNNYIYFEK